MLWTTIVCDWCCITGSQKFMWLPHLFSSWCYRTNMCVTGVVSLNPRCYEADIMVHVVENHSVCDRCYITWKLWFYLAYYLCLSSGEFISISSHMCGSWYLPIFLLRDESFALMKMASLIGYCQIFIFSTNNAEVVNRYIMTSVVEMVIDGWWGFHVFFVSFCKCSAWFPNIFFFTVHSTTCVSIYYLTFLSDGISVLRLN